MTDQVIVPPIKCQGIKTKLVPTILRYLDRDPDGLWVEPFLGSGVVVLNVAPRQALLSDSNPYVVRFYRAIRDGEIDGPIARSFLEYEGAKLSECGADHYYHIRDRFNELHDPLDFLFLNRSCFNGVMRFNKKGEFNVPFCKKPERFRPAYVSKIVNQIVRFQQTAQASDWEFVCQDFQSTIRQSNQTDFIYCDPPYLGRHVDYYNDWTEASETILRNELRDSSARFMVSSWYGNSFRTNYLLHKLWKGYHIATRQHFYHVGAKETNRKAMLEALVTNYCPLLGGDSLLARSERIDMQLTLLPTDGTGPV